MKIVYSILWSYKFSRLLGIILCKIYWKMSQAYLVI